MRSAKYPNPATLTDRVKPTYKEWAVGLRDKLIINADWYQGGTEVETHARQVAYLKTTIKEKAFEHLISYLD